MGCYSVMRAVLLLADGVMQAMALEGVSWSLPGHGGFVPMGVHRQVYEVMKRV